MYKIMSFGENVPGYNIPVLNEREIRAAAGILFLLMLISILVVILQGNFILLKYAVTIFYTDILIRVFINPKFAPLLILGRMIVRNQVPEYVGADQKWFAWSIGALLATIIFIHLVIVNAFSPITGIICITCLLFLFFETAFGICLGCKIYSLIYKEKAQHCPGEICRKEKMQNTQKISGFQMIIIIGFIASIFITFYLFNDNFNKKPKELFRIEQSANVK